MDSNRWNIPSTAFSLEALDALVSTLALLTVQISTLVERISQT